MIDLDDIHLDHLIDQARTYSRAPLIEYLRDGRTVTPALAAFLADVLEGRVPKPRKRGRLKRKLPSFWMMRVRREAYKEGVERFRGGHLDADEKAKMKDWLKRSGYGAVIHSVAEAADALMRDRFAPLSESELLGALRRKKRKVKTMR